VKALEQKWFDKLEDELERMEMDEAILKEEQANQISSESVQHL